MELFPPTAGRDVKREILLNINDERTFISTCSLNTDAVKLCDDSVYYNRLKRKYPDTLQYKDSSEKTQKMTWKEYYLYNMFYIGKLLEAGVPLKSPDGFAVRIEGNPKFYYWITKMKRDEVRLEKAALYGYTDLFFYLEEETRKNLRKELEGDEADVEAELGDYYEAAFLEAVETDKGEAIAQYILKEHENALNFYPLALYAAAKNGNKNMVNLILEAASRNNVPIDVEFYNSILTGAAAGGNEELFDFAIRRGATDFVGALENSYSSLDEKWIEYVTEIAREKDVNFNDHFSNVVALDRAAYHGNLTEVKKQLEKIPRDRMWKTRVNSAIVQAVVGMNRGDNFQMEKVYERYDPVLDYLLEVNKANNDYKLFKSYIYQNNKWYNYFTRMEKAVEDDLSVDED